MNKENSETFVIVKHKVTFVLVVEDSLEKESR